MGKVILLFLFGLLLGQNDPVLLSIRDDAQKAGIPSEYLNNAFDYSGITVHEPGVVFINYIMKILKTFQKI